jgi:hypothetical protein
MKYTGLEDRQKKDNYTHHNLCADDGGGAAFTGFGL